MTVVFLVFLDYPSLVCSIVCRVVDFSFEEVPSSIREGPSYACRRLWMRRVCLHTKKALGDGNDGGKFIATKGLQKARDN